MTVNSAKACLECGDKITGRVDKKFCSDECRIVHNNRAKAPSNNYVRNVTNALLRNRRIMEDLNPTGKTRIHVDKLLERGFNFKYFTSIYTTREGAEYHYCFEHGYLSVDNNYYLLVVKKDL